MELVDRCKSPWKPAFINEMSRLKLLCHQIKKPTFDFIPTWTALQFTLFPCCSAPLSTNQIRRMGWEVEIPQFCEKAFPNLEGETEEMDFLGNLWSCDCVLLNHYFDPEISPELSVGTKSSIKRILFLLKTIWSIDSRCFQNSWKWWFGFCAPFVGKIRPRKAKFSKCLNLESPQTTNAFTNLRHSEIECILSWGR